MKYHSIHPGQLWHDTEGKRIQAHGGSIYYENSTFYWYGEDKTYTDGKNGIWHNGVRAYTSKDLYNWEDQGTIIAPSEDIHSSLHPTAQMDRPHIVRNTATGKYVCWLKIMNRDGTQSMTILTANAFLGPYQLEKENYRPLGMNSGDFDLAVAPDGKAYIYFERVHSELICADLTEDYLGVSGQYSTHFPRKSPPFVREGVAHFTHGGKHYLLTSGTTGYLPNPTEIAVADAFHGPFQILGNPHINDVSNTSFHSQISSVFKVPGKQELYIALADRWKPNCMDLKYEEYAALFEKAFNKSFTLKDKEQVEKMQAEYPEMGIDNTCIADYVWLPLQFTASGVNIPWMDEWSPKNYQ